MGARQLTWEEAQDARRRYAAREATIESLADEFDMTMGSMGSIVRWETYQSQDGWNPDRATVPMMSDHVHAWNGIYHGNGQGLSVWLWNRGCDQRDINRITARRFQYGSYRPSDRAALLIDASPTLTPYAPESTTMAAD